MRGWCRRARRSCRGRAAPAARCPARGRRRARRRCRCRRIHAACWHRSRARSWRVEERPRGRKFSGAPSPERVLTSGYLGLVAALPPASAARRSLARHLSGEGIEIGPSCKPFPLPPGARVRYLDRWTPVQAKELYPELTEYDFVAPDVVVDVDSE